MIGRATRAIAQLLAPLPPQDLTPAGALQRVAGYTARQAGISLVLLALMAALAWRQRAFDWLAVFGLMLAPVILAGLAAHASRRWPQLRWSGMWSALLLLVAASTCAAMPLYRWCAQAFGGGALSTSQVAACVAGFATLTLLLPLWHLHSKTVALRLATVERSALAAELKALQAQIEPHFLFNTLANTRYLVRQDAGRALLMLDHLIGYLRSALPDLRQGSSTLGRECELAEHYLSIMAIRFGQRMSWHIDCPASLQHAALPPLMLMSLVENAVQHGVEPALGDVRVTLSARADGGMLHVCVRDNGCGAAAAAPAPVEQRGLGLHNLRARLAALYGEAAGFELRMTPGRPTQAELRLPLEMTLCEPRAS